MRKEITVAAEPRSSRGKNEARRLRVKGMAPGVLYGAERDAVAISISPKEVQKILRTGAGHNTIFNLSVAGLEDTPAMIVDWQNDPVRENLLHVDLKRIDLAKPIRVKVRIQTAGEAKGVKLQGGLMEVVTREIEVECLPDDIPELYTMDVTELMIGQHLRASDVPLPESIKLVSPADQVIAHVVSVKAEEEPAAAEGAVAATPAEPEVIKKGKKDEEGEEGKEEKGKKK